MNHVSGTSLRKAVVSIRRLGAATEWANMSGETLSLATDRELSLTPCTVSPSGNRLHRSALTDQVISEGKDQLSQLGWLFKQLEVEGNIYPERNGLTPLNGRREAQLLDVLFYRFG